jgi:hypothetical protein
MNTLPLHIARDKFEAWKKEGRGLDWMARQNFTLARTSANAMKIMAVHPGHDAWLTSFRPDPGFHLKVIPVEREKFGPARPETQRPAAVPPTSAGPQRTPIAAPPAEPKARILPLLFAYEIGREPVPRNDLVQDFLPSAALVLFFGVPKGGKTFFAVDLSLHVATGRPWRGRAVKRGAVLYLALEGTAGIRNRLIAWLTHHDVDATDVAFAILPGTRDLLSDDGADEVIEAAKQVAERTGLDVQLIVIDTVARALGGGDENGSDMGKFVRAVDRIREETGATVLGIHHPVKNGTGGERGHGSLRGALDVRIEIARGKDNVSTATVIEARDIAAGGVYGFELEVVELGADSDGRPITSCVAVATEVVEATSTKPEAEAQRLKAQEMKAGGASVRDIAQALGASKSSIQRLLTG